MTDDEKAFLDAVASAPADDTTRLVYADWLDEHGEPVRADAVRRGVKHPKRFTFKAGAPAVVAYTSDRPDIRGVVSATLAAGHPGVAWTTYKGLIESATCDWVTWLGQGDQLLAENCVPEVVLTTIPHLNLLSHVATGRGYGIPGRALQVIVPYPDDPRLAVLAATWPQVRRWTWPKLVTHAIRSGQIPIGITRCNPQIGETVRLVDGSEGVLASAVGDDGYALVRPRAPGEPK